MTQPLIAPGIVAEAIFLAIDRRVWHHNLVAETYRLIDLGVMVALLVGGVVLPVVFEKDRRRRRLVYLISALAGVGRGGRIPAAAGAHRGARVGTAERPGVQRARPAVRSAT